MTIQLICRKITELCPRKCRIGVPENPPSRLLAERHFHEFGRNLTYFITTRYCKMFGSRLRLISRTVAVVAKSRVAMSKSSIRPTIAFRAFSSPAGADDKKSQESAAQAKSGNDEARQKTDLANMDFDEYDDYEPRTAKEKVRDRFLFVAPT
ncbi:hypothetical protein EON65_39560 [archaeon]|nr:MAG: hypothetical protein EON65_39560 [archaeon]